MRRCATSDPTNIAEGVARNSRADYVRFVDIAVGSVIELEYQLILSKDLGYLESRRSADLRQECREIRSILIELRNRALTTDDFYSYDIASRMSVLAATREGGIAAATPPMAAATRNLTSWPPGMVNLSP